MKDIRLDLKDPWGRRVVLREKQWKHIIVERQRAIELYAIRLVVEHPQFVYASNKSKTDELFFRLGAESKHPLLYVAVVIAYPSEPGFIRTAMLQGQPSGVDWKRGLKYVYRDI